MKKLLILTGIVSFLAIDKACIAQTGPVTAVSPTTGAVVNSGSGNVSTKSAISNAETDRAVQEARKIKALKASMADKSFQGRQPVAYTASQFLANNRPPPQPVTSSQENTPYLVPETYPRTSVPAFKPAKKNQSAGGNDNAQGNPYSYPGRVSENEKPPSSPESGVTANSGSDLPKKRPNFFKWMKERKTAKPKASSQVGNTPPTTQRDFAVPGNPEVAKKEVEEIPTETPKPSAMSAPAPPPSASATPVRPEVSTNPARPSASAIPARPSATPAQASAVPATKPSTVAKPNTASPETGKNKSEGLFGKLFNNQGNKKSSRTISSDPAQPENIELPRN